MPTKKKPKRVRFSGYDAKSSEDIHDKAERIVRAVMTPLKKENKKEKV